MADKDASELTTEELREEYFKHGLAKNYKYGGVRREPETAREHELEAEVRKRATEYGREADRPTKK